MPEPTFLEKLLMRHDSTWRHLPEPQTDTTSSPNDKQKPLSPLSSSLESPKGQQSELSSVASNSLKAHFGLASNSSDKQEQQQTQVPQHEQQKQQSQPVENQWSQQQSESSTQQQQKSVDPLEHSRLLRRHMETFILAKARQQQEAEAAKVRQQEAEATKVLQQQEAEATRVREQQQADAAKVRQQEADAAKVRQQQEAEAKKQMEEEHVEQANMAQRIQQTRQAGHVTQQQYHDSYGKQPGTASKGTSIDVPQRNANYSSAGFIKNDSVASSSTDGYDIDNTSTYNGNPNANTQYSDRPQSYPTYKNISKTFNNTNEQHQVDDTREDNFHRRLFIPNLPESATASDLREFFAQYPVVDVLKKRGCQYGFVEFESLEACLTARKLKQKQEFQGVPITLRKSRPRPSKHNRLINDEEESHEHLPNVFSRLEPSMQLNSHGTNYEDGNYYQHGASNHSSSYHQSTEDMDYKRTSLKRQPSSETDYYDSATNYKRKNLTSDAYNYGDKGQEDQQYERSARDYDHYSTYSRQSSRSPDRGSHSHQPCRSSSSNRSEHQSSSNRDSSQSRLTHSRQLDTSKERSDSHSLERQRSPARRSDVKSAPSDPRKRPSSSSRQVEPESKRHRILDDTKVDDKGEKDKSMIESLPKEKDTITAPGTESATTGSSAITNITSAIMNDASTTVDAVPITTNTTNTINITTVKNTTDKTSSSEPVMNTRQVATSIPTAPANTTSVLTTIPTQTTRTVGTTSIKANATKEDPRLHTKERQVDNTTTNTTLRTAKALTEPSNDQSLALTHNETPITPAGGQTLEMSGKQQTLVPFTNTANEKAVIQLICIGSAIQPNVIGDLEDYMEQNLRNVKCRTIFYPTGMMTRDDILKQVHVDNALAVILLENGYEEHGKVFLQVYDQQRRGKHSLHFDDYEGISATDAIHIILQRIQPTKESISPPNAPASAPLSFLNHTPPPAIKAEQLTMQPYCPSEQQAQQQQQQMAANILYQLYHNGGMSNPAPSFPGQALPTPTTMTLHKNHPGTNTNQDNFTLLVQVLTYLEKTENEPYNPSTYNSRLAIINQTLANLKTFQPPLQFEQECIVTRHLIFHLQQLASQQPYGRHPTYQPQWQQTPPSSSGPYYNIH